MTPFHISDRLRALADSMVRSAAYYPSLVVFELMRMAAEVEGPVRLKLLSTSPSEEETADETTYVQEWLFTLPDGSKINTTTEVGWGEEPSDVPHGDVVLNVCGHSLTVEQVLGFVLSTGDGPVKDGEEIVLDGEWCSNMSKVGHL